MIARGAPRIRSQLARWAGRRHLCIDVREGCAHWTLARATRTGLRPLEYGRVDRAHGESDAVLVQRLSAAPMARGARIELAVRSGDIEHRRIDLPPLGAREIARVAKRRAGELRAAARECDRIVDSVTSRSTRGGAIWLCSGRIEGSPAAAVVEVLGPRLHRLTSRSLALGNLGRVLPPLPDGALTGILDLDRESGLCVIADADGWLFGRQIALKFAGDRRARGFTASEENEAGPGPGERRLGWGARIRTELARTFRYIESELGMGRVARVVVAGDSSALSPLAAALAAQLDLPVQLLPDALADTPMRGVPPGAAVAVGLACAPASEGANLLALPVRRRRDEILLRRRLAAGLAGVIGIGAAAALAVSLRVGTMEDRIRELESRWQQTAPDRARLAHAVAMRERHRALARALGAIHRPEPSWGHLLEVLGRVAPDRLFVHRLTAGLEEDVWRTTILVEATASSIAEGAQTVVSFSRDVADASVIELDEVVRENLADRPAGVATRDEAVRFRLQGRLAPLASEAGIASPIDARSSNRRDSVEGSPDA